MSSFWIAIPLIAFMIFVAPLWLILHYRSKRKTSGGLSQEDFQRLDALSGKSEQLQKRVETLERILDAESPSWRRRYE
ncbi:envelope stress response membrane protein PspB [Vibrio renipiscarius]|uniref:Phage-shock protein n=1 Tax=Vibrio renipiscarius TaxID=1461322 RepID=A0A0C2JVH7_9VIBR|nr:envelope stress response membrane protein PspB [Vibrio renipiscarius]KII75581.1 phage-shock protein [Vibrio renipiscarius]KII81969.1 phage-shock protein [Vibrio renipiscarius]